MRRRLRRQRQMREALLLDLGALVYELHRQGRREPELLQAKAAELTAVDEEVRALAEALGTGHSVMQLVATGVAGSCENCGSLMSVDQRYCSSCGAPAVPALSADGERSAFAERTDEYAALSIGPEDDNDLAPGDYESEDHEFEAAAYAGQPEGGGEPYPADGYESEEFEQVEDESYESASAEPSDEGVFRVTRMTPEAEEAEEAESEAEQPESEAEQPESEAEQPEPEPEVPESEPEVPEPEPAAAGPEPEPEAADPEREMPPDETLEPPEESTTAQPDRASEEDSDGRAAHDGAAAPAGAPHTAPPPRAVADDALDSAGKAIRSGIERGRQWLLGRREP